MDGATAAGEAAFDEAQAHSLRVLEWADVAEALAAECASAVAAEGSRRLLPLRPDGEIRRWHALTRELLALFEEEPPPLAGVRDVARAVGLAALGGAVEAGDLAAIARSAESLARLWRWFRAAPRRAAAPLSAEVADRVVPHEALAASIDAAIDERGAVREDASPHLRRLHQRRLALGARVEEALQAVRRDPDVAAALSDDYVTVRDGRYVLPVRADRRTAVPGILHGRSGSGHSVFVEPQVVVELNNDLRAVELEIEEEVQRILAALASAVAGAAPELERSLEAHRELDLAAARARLARRLQATVPGVVEDGDLSLPALAHPLLLLLGGGAAKATHVVHNDVTVPAAEPGLLISGPNTGGKTVLMKAIGLACLMASAGLPVCAGAGASLPSFRRVLADIGDEQSLARSLSSFAAHVANLNAILRSADAARPRPSLVLLDELMSGTDPAEGGALARALLETLTATGARAVVTTHLGELKAFAAEHPAWRNSAMSFDPANLSPTWRLSIGLPGASAALMVAERLGLPRDLLERARVLASDETLRAEALLAELESAREAALIARAEADRHRQAAQRLRAEADERLAALKRRESSELQALRDGFEAELRAARAEAAAVTRELQRKPSLQASAEAIARLDALRRSLPDVPARGGAGTAGPGTLRLEPGARVTSRSMGREGELLEEPDAQGRVRVGFGAVTVQLPVADLTGAAGGAAGAGGRPLPGGGRAARRPPSARAATTDAGPPAGGVPFTPQGERNACDLRGLTVDEALDRLGRFLGDAARSGERTVVVIHGHGTGALKRAVRSALPAEPLVAAFRPGQDGEGGDGVTVAALA